MPKSAASGPHMGNFVGPIWADQMGSMSIWPRAPCPPQMGSRRMSLLGLVWAPLGQPIMGCQYGPHVGSSDGLDVHLAAGSMSAPNGQPTNEPLGLVWAPLGQPILGCQYGPHVGSPDGLDVHLAAGSMSAPNGQPTNEPLGLSVGPSWAAHYGFPIWAPRGQPRWARCPFDRGLHVRPKWAADE